MNTVQTLLRSFCLVFGLSWRIGPARTAVVAVLTVVQQLAGVLLALSLGWTVDAVPRHDTGLLITGIITAAAAQAALVTGWSALTVQRVMLNQRVGEEIDRDVLRRVAKLPGVVHLEESAQLDLIERARRGGQQMAGAVWTSVATSLVVLQLVVSLVLMARVDRGLAWLALCVLPTFWSTHRGKREVRHAHMRAAEPERAERELFEASTDPARAKETRLGGGTGFVIRRAAALRRTAEDLRVRGETRAALIQSVGWGAFLAGYVGALAYTSSLVLAGRTGAGSLLLVATLATHLRQNIAMVVGGMQGSAEGRESLAAYMWLRAHGRGQDDAAPVLERLTEGIRLRGVRFRYPSASQDSLRGIDLDLPAGATVALVGDHGSGKSTLVKLLCALYAPSEGEVTVDGIPLASFSAEEWRRRITATFQDFCRFPLTVSETVGLGDLARLDDRAALERSVRAAGADRVVARLPEGMNSLLGTAFGPGSDLSGGQWQTLAVARALLRERVLLAVFDEPTAALDAAAEADAYRSYALAARSSRRSAKGITLLVSHRFATVRSADLIVVLAEGRIVEQGTHRQLMTRNGRYAELYQLQEKAYHGS
ncbi:ATP-binding cassette domain-containing protein [Streptomyces sp. NPDC058284]|uniref:ATP-binding cassette domain-containing protein n=1 Tax=unclassified Streptomyces TaxID=2593676 RepID=UPI003647167B